MTTGSSGLVQHLGYVDTLKVAITICLTYTLIVSCIRVHLRKASFGSDDVAVLIATVFALIHFATSYACLTAGLGKPYEMIDASLGQLSSTAIAGVITFILALYAAKISALMFLMRIEAKTRSPVLYYAIAGLMAVFAIASAICVTVDCPSGSGYYWNLAGNQISCPSEANRWHAMAALDMFSEIILLILPVHLVYPLQMPRQRKIMVVVTFWTRLPTIALGVVREYYIKRLRTSSTDVSLGSTIVVILMEVELAYAVIACTLSTSKNFTDGFNTGWGMGHIRGAAESYNMSAVGGSGSRSRNMKNTTTTMDSPDDYTTTNSFDKSRKTVHRQSPSHEFQEESGLQLRPDPSSQTVVHSDRTNWGGENGSVSSESDDLVIVRHTEYTVSHDEAPILQHPM